MPDVLVVEDNSVNQRLVCLILGSIGLSYTTVQNGLEAVEATLTDDYRLILMDLMMPVMDGLAATRRIKHNPRTAHIPVVALTACALEFGRVTCQEAGCCGYITKPYTRSALIEAVHRHILSTDPSASDSGQTQHPQPEPE